MINDKELINDEWVNDINLIIKIINNKERVLNKR